MPTRRTFNVMWSPGGEWLAVEMKRGERTHIGVIARNRGPIEQLTDEPGATPAALLVAGRRAHR